MRVVEDNKFLILFNLYLSFVIVSPWTFHFLAFTMDMEARNKAFNIDEYQPTSLDSFIFYYQDCSNSLGGLFASWEIWAQFSSYITWDFLMIKLHLFGL